MTVTYFGDKRLTKELSREQLIDSPPPVIAVDIETISLTDVIPVGFAVATSPFDAYYFQVMPNSDEEIELIKPLLMNPKITKVFHNAIFDIEAAPLICNIDRSNIADSNISYRMLGYQETNLQALARDIYAQELITSKDLLAEFKSKDMLGLPFESISAMCASHAKLTLRLYFDSIDKIDQQYFATEMKTIPILIDMSQRGMKINQHDRQQLEDKLTAEVKYYRDICEAEDFNPGSPYQVGFTLAKRANFLPFTKSKKQYRTDEETLMFLDDPLATAVLNYREVNTLLTRYIKPLADKERIYTRFNLDSVVFRINSSKMNLH